MDKLESVQKELKDLGEKHNKLERRMDKDDADECRTRILRFADELRRDVKHSEELGSLQPFQLQYLLSHLPLSHSPALHLLQLRKQTDHQCTFLHFLAQA